MRGYQTLPVNRQSLPPQEGREREDLRHDLVCRQRHHRLPPALHQPTSRAASDTAAAGRRPRASFTGGTKESEQQLDESGLREPGVPAASDPHARQSTVLSNPGMLPAGQQSPPSMVEVAQESAAFEHDPEALIVADLRLSERSRRAHDEARMLDSRGFV